MDPFHCAGKRCSVTAPRLFHAAIRLHATLFRRWCRPPSSSSRHLPRFSAYLHRLLVLSESTAEIEHVTAALLMLYVEFIPTPPPITDSPLIQRCSSYHCEISQITPYIPIVVCALLYLPLLPPSVIILRQT
ncbi:hypothetical protein B0H14DRAFT_3854401 [Mycena olivaceomarginata]|nr:hypothetical protein B0H14DRAFT_3854401 [Mycena olivaceomarginata]